MSDKRKSLETILAKLRKLLPHLGNGNANEAAAALGKINDLLKSVKLDWHDMASLMTEEQPSLLEILAKLFAKPEERLVRLGLAGAEFFHSNSDAFADVVVAGHRNTWPVASAEFYNWLLLQFFNETGEVEVPSGAAMKAAIRTLSARAKIKGERHDVHLRAALLDGKIYLDIGDPEWHVVEIDGTGWRMVDNPPVRFRRTQGMQALPIPKPGGSIDQLRPLVNLDDDGFVLLVAWILDALYPGRPHPVLYLAGEEGSAKSTAAKIARSLIDPNSVPLRNLPTTVREIFVAANGSHAMVFDNASSISPAISDALCQVATGSGFGARRLFTDTSQILVGGYHPVVINGLQNVISRSDLADRAVVIPMKRVIDEQRRSESELWNRFKRDRAQIFGALLDCVACGLRQLRSVHLSRLPRMADFALWSVATDAFAPGVFIEAFEGAATEATEAVVEADPVAVAVSAYMMGRDFWSGTAAELLFALSSRDHTEAAPSRSRMWPREVSAFGRRLRLATSVLRKLGIEVTTGKASDRSRTRTITLSLVAPSERPHLVPDPPGDGSDTADGADTGVRATPNGTNLLKPRLLKG
jgi:hypothetical protein